MKLTVFCGSRFGNKESYKFIAQTLGKYMAQEEIELVTVVHTPGLWE